MGRALDLVAPDFNEDGPKIPTQEDIAKALGNVQQGEDTDAKEGSNGPSGTFSAFAASLTGATTVQSRSESLQERTAKASEKMLEVLKGKDGAKPDLQAFTDIDNTLKAIAQGKETGKGSAMDQATKQAEQMNAGIDQAMQATMEVQQPKAADGGKDQEALKVLRTIAKNTAARPNTVARFA